MADTVITLKGREKLAKARAGINPLPAITKIAFGNGGVDGTNTPIIHNNLVTQLGNEVLRKDVSISYPDSTTNRYSGSIGKEELPNVDISEIALFDADDDLIAIRTFFKKKKDLGIEMIFEMDDAF